MCVYNKIQVVNEHYKTSGYTAVGKPVDIEVTTDDENVEVSADLDGNVKECWYIEQQQVCVSLCRSLVINLYMRTLSNVMFS